MEITNLLYEYAESMDAGDFEGCSVMFADAVVILASIDIVLGEVDR